MKDSCRNVRAVAPQRDSFLIVWCFPLLSPSKLTPPPLREYPPLLAPGPRARGVCLYISIFATTQLVGPLPFRGVLPKLLDQFTNDARHFSSRCLSFAWEQCLHREDLQPLLACTKRNAVRVCESPTLTRIYFESVAPVCDATEAHKRPRVPDDALWMHRSWMPSANCIAVTWNIICHP